MSKEENEEDSIECVKKGARSINRNNVNALMPAADYYYYSRMVSHIYTVSVGAAFPSGLL